MKNFIAHARGYVIRGLLAIIPLLLCYSAVQLLYNLIDKRIMHFLYNHIGLKQIPGLGIVLLLVCLYFIGLIFSNIIGNQFFRFIEGISKRIPLISSIYGVGKQLSQGLLTIDQEKQAFKKAVLIKINKEELMVPAFVVSSLINRKTNEEYLFVIVPASPTPSHGFIFVVKASETIDPGWTVEECLKTIVSVGIVSPKEIKA